MFVNNKNIMTSKVYRKKLSLKSMTSKIIWPQPEINFDKKNLTQRRGNKYEYVVIIWHGNRKLFKSDKKILTLRGSCDWIPVDLVSGAVFWKYSDVHKELTIPCSASPATWVGLLLKHQNAIINHRSVFCYCHRNFVKLQIKDH